MALTGVTDFRDLVVWHRSVDLAVECYRVTRKFPVEEKFGLVSQIRRSTTAVAANIAEGSGRRTTRELIHALGVANGELKEAESHLEIARRLGYLDDECLDQLRSLALEIGRMLTALRRSLESHRNRSSQHSPVTSH
jgi:four helix bundle protein